MGPTASRPDRQGLHLPALLVRRRQTVAERRAGVAARAERPAPAGGIHSADLLGGADAASAAGAGEAPLRILPARLSCASGDMTRVLSGLHGVASGSHSGLRGYTRIRGVLKSLGHEVASNTIKAILKDQGIEPAPERSTKTPRKTFLGGGRLQTSRTRLWRRTGRHAGTAGTAWPPCRTLLEGTRTPRA